jgi:hypothetical protein
MDSIANSTREKVMRVSLLFSFFILLQPIQVSAQEITQEIGRAFENLRQELLYTIGDAEILYKNREYSRAFPAFERAADNGNAHAQYRLYEMYRMGRFVPKNTRRMMEWLTKAVAQEYPPALDDLSDLYNLDGSWYGIEEDQALSFYYKYRALELGYGSWCSLTNKLESETFIFKEMLQGKNQEIALVIDLADDCAYAIPSNLGLSTEEKMDIEDAALDCFESGFTNCGLPRASAFLEEAKLQERLREEEARKREEEARMQELQRDADEEMKMQIAQITPADQGWIGVELEWSNETKLARVLHVISESPAHTLIRSGDYISAIRFEKPNSLVHLKYMLATQTPGTSFLVEVIRENRVNLYAVKSGNVYAFVEPLIEEFNIEPQLAYSVILEASRIGMSPVDYYFQSYNAHVRPTSDSMEIAMTPAMRACRYVSGTHKIGVSFSIEKSGKVKNVKALNIDEEDVWIYARVAAGRLEFPPLIRRGEAVRVENTERILTIDCDRNSLEIEASDVN